MIIKWVLAGGGGVSRWNCGGAQAAVIFTFLERSVHCCTGGHDLSCQINRCMLKGPWMHDFHINSLEESNWTDLVFLSAPVHDLIARRKINWIKNAFKRIGLTFAPSHPIDTFKGTDAPPFVIMPYMILSFVKKSQMNKPPMIRYSPISPLNPID